MPERDPDSLLEAFAELTTKAPRPVVRGALRPRDGLARLAGSAIAFIAISALAGMLFFAAVGAPAATTPPVATPPVAAATPTAATSPRATAVRTIGPSPPRATIPMCDSLPSLSAPTDRYDGRRASGRNVDELTELARSWASTRPGFQGIWIDRALHDGWITLAFTGDDEARQAEAVEEFPDAPVVVVGVDWTRAELDALLRRVREEVEPIIWAVGITLNKGVVGIDLEPDGVAALEERFAGERVCFTFEGPVYTQPEILTPTLRAISAECSCPLGFTAKSSWSIHRGLHERREWGVPTWWRSTERGYQTARSGFG